LDDKYDIFRTKGGYLNERQKEIQNFIGKNQPVKISDISKSLENITIHTLKKDLQYMKTEKMITAVGKEKELFI